MVAALDAARAVFRSQIEASHDRVIDMAGESVLAVFETATGAVLAALAVQGQLNGDRNPEDRRMRFRIGVHMGDVFEKPDGTIYGDGVLGSAPVFRQFRPFPLSLLWSCGLVKSKVRKITPIQIIGLREKCDREFFRALVRRSAIENEHGAAILRNRLPRLVSGSPQDGCAAHHHDLARGGCQFSVNTRSWQIAALKPGQ